MRSVLGHLRPWLLPGGLVLLGAAAWTRFFLDPEAPDTAPAGYAYAVYAGALLLAFRFQRSRVALAALIVALVDRALPEVGGEAQDVAFAAAGVLVPLALAAAAYTRDRGVLSVRGLSQLAGAAGLLAMVAVFVVAAPQALDFATAPLFEGGEGPTTPLAQPALAAFAVGFVALVWRSARRADPVDKGLLWAFVAVFLGMQAYPGTTVATVWLVAAGLALGLSVVETSYFMAFHDELTGLPARRALFRAMEDLTGDYAVAMVDVDHFKRFNDRHGHDVGDQVLRMVAARLARTPAGGKAFRYGGEEFAILFPGSSVDEALPALEATRQAVAASTFTLRGRGRPRVRADDPGAVERWRSRPGVPSGRGGARASRLSVTVSVGVAAAVGDPPTPEKTLKEADRALYRAKRAGRNRVAR